MTIQRRTAIAYLRGDRVTINSQCEDVNGVLRFQEPVFAFDRRGIDAAELVVAVVRALEQCRHGVPTPEDLSFKPLAPLLRAVGVRSYAALAKSSDMVQISLDAGVLTYEPMHNEGVAKGWTTLSSAVKKTLPLTAPLRGLGQELLDAFGRCTRAVG